MMISGIMTPKGAEDFVAPAALKDMLAARIPATAWRSTPSLLKRGDLETFRRDAFDLQRVQTEEALLPDGAMSDWDLFWVMSHTLDKLQHFFWRYMDPEHPAYPGHGDVRARDPRLPRGVRRGARAHHRRGAARDAGGAPLGSRLGAAAHVLLHHELAVRRRLPRLARRQRDPTRSRGDGRRRQGARPRPAERGPRLGAAARAARSEARRAPGAHLLQQGRGSHRLEPHACVLSVGTGERALDQPAWPRARGDRRRRAPSTSGS